MGFRSIFFQILVVVSPSIMVMAPSSLAAAQAVVTATTLLTVMNPSQEVAVAAPPNKHNRNHVRLVSLRSLI